VDVYVTKLHVSNLGVKLTMSNSYEQIFTSF